MAQGGGRAARRGVRSPRTPSPPGCDMSCRMQLYRFILRTQRSLGGDVIVFIGTCTSRYFLGVGGGFWEC